jgi:hypothetical protein
LQVFKIFWQLPIGSELKHFSSCKHSSCIHIAKSQCMLTTEYPVLLLWPPWSTLESKITIFLWISLSEESSRNKSCLFQNPKRPYSCLPCRVLFQNWVIEVGVRTAKKGTLLIDHLLDRCKIMKRRFSSGIRSLKKSSKMERFLYWTKIRTLFLPLFYHIGN